jgi:tight adherence protein C
MSTCGREDSERLTFAVPVVFLVLPVTVLFALFPGLISIVSLAR